MITPTHPQIVQSNPELEAKTDAKTVRFTARPVLLDDARSCPQRRDPRGPRSAARTSDSHDIGALSICRRTSVFLSFISGHKDAWYVTEGSPGPGPRYTTFESVSAGFNYRKLHQAHSAGDEKVPRYVHLGTPIIFMAAKIGARTCSRTRARSKLSRRTAEHELERLHAGLPTVAALPRERACPLIGPGSQTLRTLSTPARL
jgi:hypothetical protein